MSQSQSQPPLTQRHLPSTHFIESSGAILFDLSPTPPQVCLIHHLPKNQWLLAKGRRNLHESRLSAALRETSEETGFACRAFPVTLATRAPGESEEAGVRDEVRVYEGCREPFMVTVREGGGVGVKFIWWFVAVVEGGRERVGVGEEEFEARFFEVEEARERLFFEGDREVLARAVEIVEETLKAGGGELGLEKGS